MDWHVLRLHVFLRLADDWDRRKQEFGVRMDRIFENLRSFSHLAHFSVVNNQSSIAKVRDETQVMRDKEIGDIELFFEAFQQSNYLCLYGYVKCGSRFVQDDNLRV